MSKLYKVGITITEVETEEVNRDRYDKVTTSGRNATTVLLEGTYALDTIQKMAAPQIVTNFLLALAGDGTGDLLRGL
jgi:hypothetical protein